MSRLDRWEHMRVPVTAETTPADFDELGAHGWELAAIDRGFAWFRRSLHRKAGTAMAERHARGESSLSA